MSQCFSTLFMPWSSRRLSKSCHPFSLRDLATKQTQFRPWFQMFQLEYLPNLWKSKHSKKGWGWLRPRLVWFHMLRWARSEILFERIESLSIFRRCCTSFRWRNRDPVPELTVSRSTSLISVRRKCAEYPTVCWCYCCELYPWCSELWETSFKPLLTISFPKLFHPKQLSTSQHLKDKDSSRKKSPNLIPNFCMTHW